MILPAIAYPVTLTTDEGKPVQTHITFREHGNPYGPAADADHFVALVTGFMLGTKGDGETLCDYYHPLAQEIYWSNKSGKGTRCFSVNHPGYDRQGVPEFDSTMQEVCSISQQPEALLQGLRSLIRDNVPQKATLTVYGFSMGGVAVSKVDVPKLKKDAAAAGKDIDVRIILSAPAYRIGPVPVLLSTPLHLREYAALLKSIPNGVEKMDYFFVNAGHIMYTVFRPYLGVINDEVTRRMRETDPYVILRHGMGLLNQNDTDEQVSEYLGRADTILLAQRDALIQNKEVTRLSTKVKPVTIPKTQHTLERFHHALHLISAHITEF